jgi:hypothetical protein
MLAVSFHRCTLWCDGYPGTCWFGKSHAALLHRVVVPMFPAPVLINNYHDSVHSSSPHHSLTLDGTPLRYCRHSTRGQSWWGAVSARCTTFRRTTRSANSRSAAVYCTRTPPSLFAPHAPLHSAASTRIVPSPRPASRRSARRTRLRQRPEARLCSKSSLQSLNLARAPGTDTRQGPVQYVARCSKKVLAIV